MSNHEGILHPLFSVTGRTGALGNTQRVPGREMIRGMSTKSCALAPSPCIQMIDASWDAVGSTTIGSRT